jgi:hypothetical protein
MEASGATGRAEGFTIDRQGGMGLATDGPDVPPEDLVWRDELAQRAKSYGERIERTRQELARLERMAAAANAALQHVDGPQKKAPESSFQ